MAGHAFTHNEGSELPANLFRCAISRLSTAFYHVAYPIFEYPVPLSQMIGASNDMVEGTLWTGVYYGDRSRAGRGQFQVRTTTVLVTVIVVIRVCVTLPLFVDDRRLRTRKYVLLCFRLSRPNYSVKVLLLLLCTND